MSTFSKFMSWLRHRFSFSFLRSFFKLIREFVVYLLGYTQKQILILAATFEKNKNLIVKFFMMKRGRYNRPFLHISAMSVLAVAILVAPFLADTYPVFSSQAVGANNVQISQDQAQSIAFDSNVFQTQVSQKPRDKVVTYAVEKGDTISSIAQKFGVDSDTIRWENNLIGDSISVGDEIRILPVTGISHKVAKGETVYTIAKRYDVNPQKIVDFPFNDFANPETFSLVEGQMLMVPDGIRPTQKPTIRRQTLIAQGPVTITSSGFTWPVRGSISQFASWYHMALDITSPIGTPIVAAQSGTVSAINIGSWDGGYGTNLWIDNGQGLQSHYAHMSGVNMGVGDSVVAGKTVIGWVGMTGRTTGAHVHFEIRRNGALVNPLSYLQ